MVVNDDSLSLMAALSGAAARATAGGVVGALVGLGIPEYEPKAYEERIQKGGYLVAVHLGDSKNGDVIRTIMKKNGLEVSFGKIKHVYYFPRRADHEISFVRPRAYYTV